MSSNNQERRPIYHQDFESSAAAWKTRDKEMASAPASKLLIALGSVTVAILAVQGTREYMNEPVPTPRVNPAAAIYREFTPTPDTEPTQQLCTYEVYEVNEDGGSRWSVAEEYARDHNPEEPTMDIIDRMIDQSAVDENRDPNNPWKYDEMRIYSDDTCLPKD